MKKSFVALALTLLCISSAQAEMTQVTEKSQIYAYTVAVKDGLRLAGKFKCTNSAQNFPRADLDTWILEITEAWIDASGPQPAITLVRSLSDLTRQVVSVVTNKNYTEVLSATWQAQTLKDTNVGTLIAPRVEKQFVTTETTSCVREQ